MDDEQDQEADEQRRPGQPDDQRPAPEQLERLVLGPHPEDRQRVAAHVGAHGGEQPGVARLRVGPDRHVVDGDLELARLDDRLERVGELGDDVNLERGLTVVGPEPGGRVGNAGRRGVAHHPRTESLEQLLARGEVVDRLDLPVADDHVGLAAQDRPDQLGDVGTLVLVVGVGVDDHVGSKLQARVQAGLEGGGQALVIGQPDDVVHTTLTRDLDGPVARAVVDDEPLHDVEARHLAWQLSERRRELPLLVEAGDLDDELHGRAGLWSRNEPPGEKERFEGTESGQR
jgi:hypothetical protein